MLAHAIEKVKSHETLAALQYQRCEEDLEHQLYQENRGFFPN